MAMKMYALNTGSTYLLIAVDDSMGVELPKNSELLSAVEVKEYAVDRQPVDLFIIKKE